MTDAQEKREFILDSSDDDGDQTGRHSGQESYRSEIEDIVKGFILEKDLMSQGHEEEMLRMKRSFDREKADLLRHLEDEREVLRHNSRMTSTTSNETGYISGSHDSEALHLNLYGADLASSSGAKRESTGLGSARYNVDNDLVKEIAEVYLRMNNGMITSRIRPDLDIEDKFEREREVFERKFGEEKREMKRKLEEDYNYKLEQEKSRYEGQIQELRSTITDLQWQKRELESRIRNEKDKNEINFERERNEIEKRNLQMIQDLKRKMEEKHSVSLVQQKDKYEENITELQADITKLTTQLRKLNENLRLEKEIIVNRFEKEIKEMEQTFSDQRNSIKLSLEAEFALKLENETSVFRTINKKLQEDLEALEREKRDYERKQKDERRKLEDHYEEEISTMEKKHSEEKHSLKMKLEERYQHLISSEKTTLEVTVSELREEVVLLRQENSQIQAAFSKRNDELLQQLDNERDECRKKLQDAKEDITIRLENEYSQKVMNESSGHLELVQQLDRDLGMMKARYAEVEATMVALRQERDMLIRERDEMQRNLMNMGFEMDRRKAMPDSHMDNNEIDKLKEMIRNKDQEIATTKLQKEQTEISMSGLRREKMDLEDEVAKLRRTFPVKTQSEFESSPRPIKDNSELLSLQENAQRKEEEMQTLKRNIFELEARISTLQRKNEELEDELSALRRKKLEVEDEISSIKRDKSDSDNQISIIRKEKLDMDEYILTLKKKQMELDDNMSAVQRENMNKDHEIELLKRTIDSLKEEVEVLKQKVSDNKGNETERSVYSRDSYTPKGKRPTSRQTAAEDHRSKPNDNYKYMEDQFTKQSAQNVYGEQRGFDDFNESLQSIEEDVNELLRQKTELEHSVRQLKENKSQLERNIAKLQNQLGSTSPDRFDLQLNERDLGDLETKKHNLENEVRRLEERKGTLERDVAKFEHLHRSSSHGSTFPQSYERDLDDLEKKKNELEIIVRRLEDNRTALERDIAKFENSNTSRTNNYFAKPNEKNIEELERKNHDLERDKHALEKEISDLKYEIETASIEAKQRGTLEGTLEQLKAEYVDLEDRISKLRREENGLEGHIEDLKINEIDLNQRIKNLEIDEQRVHKDIARLQDEKNKLQNELQEEYGEHDNTYYGCTHQGNGRRITGITEVSIERRRKLDNKDHELADLRKERESLKQEIAALRKNLDEINNQSHQHHNQTHQIYDTYCNELSVSNEMKQIERNEVVALKKERLEIEKLVATLQRQKTEMNADITVIKEVKNREENELNALRREKMELETIVTTLQSKKTRLEAELSAKRDEMQKDDDEIDSLRRKKQEIEKQFYDLQSKTTKMEAEISMAETLRKKTDFYTDTLGIEKDVKAMRKERSELESDIKRLQSVRNREEHELSVLRKQLKDLENQISELKSGEDITRSLSVKYGDFISGGSDPYNQQSQPSLSPGRVRTSIEIPHLPSPRQDHRPIRSFEADETMVLPQYGQSSNKDDHLKRYSGFNNDNLPRQNKVPERAVFDVSFLTTTCGKCGLQLNSQDPREREEYPGGYQGKNSENIHSMNGFDPRQNHPNRKEFNDGSRTQGTHDQAPRKRENYPGTHQGRVDGDFHSVNGYEQQQNYPRTNDFNSSPHGPRVPVSSHQWESSRDGSMKEDNDVKILRKEKLELESQINELKIQMKNLQTEISGLENVKTVKEKLRGQNGGYQQSDLDFQEELKKEWRHTRHEEKNENLRQEYEEKIQELKAENAALKQKVGILQWQVENTKQKMEIQEMTFRRELSAVQEKYSKTTSSTRSTHFTEVDSDISKFKEFYQHLSYLVVRDTSNDEILREIRKAIKELDQQKDVNIDQKNSRPNTNHIKHHSYDERAASSTMLDNDEAKTAKEYANQLKIQLQLADKQLQTSEKIIHRLYAENSELNKLVHKLEHKLKSATRSTEKLQRKRALLQKLVDKLSGQVGKDQLRQAYLVLELDKDVAI